jgi:hypothetical protein
VEAAARLKAQIKEGSVDPEDLNFLSPRSRRAYRFPKGAGRRGRPIARTRHAIRRYRNSCKNLSDRIQLAEIGFTREPTASAIAPATEALGRYEMLALFALATVLANSIWLAAAQ